MTDFSPFKANVIRLVRLDVCGAAVTGTTSVYTTRGFVSVAQSPQYEDGQEFITRQADGDLCVNEKDPDRLKRIDLMLAAPLISNGMDPIGNWILAQTSSAAFSLELWNDQAGVACTTAGQTWPRWVFPWVVNARLGDISHEYGTQEWEITASTKSNPNFNTGPFHDWPSVPDNAHAGYEVGAVAPPTAAVGYQTL
jgi:hypothetical protein